jgi:hypothetical protein
VLTQSLIVTPPNVVAGRGPARFLLSSRAFRSPDDSVSGITAGVDLETIAAAKNRLKRIFSINPSSARIALDSFFLAGERVIRLGTGFVAIALMARSVQ